MIARSPRGDAETTREVPAGHVARRVRRADVIVRADLADRVVAAIAESPAGTLHDYACRHAARVFQGRGAAYAAELPGGGPSVVVRHNHHGGTFAALTGDRFLPPTRAPRELHTALRLARLGVPTPEIVAIARYPAAPFGARLLLRSDVASCEIAQARDLAALLATEHAPPVREAALEATAELLGALARAGVRHQDLNLKNILLADAPGGRFAPYLLDVDRVRFHSPADATVATRNRLRFERSARKWVRERGATIAESELERLDRRVRELSGER